MSANSVAEPQSQGRNVDSNLESIRHLRAQLPTARISIEAEKPGRPGLVELAAEADVVFYSKTWAEVSNATQILHLPGPRAGHHLPASSELINLPSQGSRPYICRVVCEGGATFPSVRLSQPLDHVRTGRVAGAESVVQVARLLHVERRWGGSLGYSDGRVPSLPCNDSRRAGRKGH